MEYTVYNDTNRAKTIKVTKLNKGRVSLQFPFDRFLKDEVKESFSRTKWNPAFKRWECDWDERTKWSLDALGMGERLKPYDTPLSGDRPYYRDYLYPHQQTMVDQLLSRRRVFWAVDMGLGKSLAIIEAAEHIIQSRKSLVNVPEEFWIICPPSLIKKKNSGWFRELNKHKARIRPKFISCHPSPLSKAMKEAKKWPRFIVWDESQDIKSPTAKKSKLAHELANQQTQAYGDDCYRVAMTGTSMPKAHTDWWSQCEFVQPGFLRENNLHRFQDRIAVVIREEGPFGNYRKVLYTQDDKCAICNQPSHEFTDHGFVPKIKCATCDEFHHKGHDCGFYQPVSNGPAPNEIDKLVRRMRGFMLSLAKKDILDLKPKDYQTIQLSPSPDMLKAAELVAMQEERAVDVLNKLRQFSDGFLYMDGNMVPMPENPKLEELKSIASIAITNMNRIIIFAAFQGSITLITELLRSLKWNVIQVDGRGWQAHGDCEASEAYFSDLANDQPIAFVGNPASCGVGLNLQVANTMVYYSNSYNAKDRTQSEDRAYRIGMKGQLTIIDLLCLPTDQIVLDTIQSRISEQDVTMEMIRDCFR